MRDAVSRNGADVAVRQEGARRIKRRATSCSVCTRRIWIEPTQVIEPEGVPEPRLSWILCRRCYQSLLAEMRRSPIKSPLMLRISMGIVASEYWPQAYPTRMKAYVSDRRWIVFIAAGFAVAMIVHLALIVLIATMK
jgi:hypothetical protein